ncbi:MAG TPA: glycoside hydrolase family 43 protein [Candidatus Polarisedimenticolaceae bacterium]|nr:glycoside hydrolase family 43 protein [Candidatus Polarisedimenticolaceae bacterium]
MQTFSNPVLGRSFPDPFVLEHDGLYWGFATGRAPDGRCFPVAASPDLVHWEPRPGAMEPLPGNAPCYWAPEVARAGREFVLYYSVGDEDTMQIRAAVSREPGGPYLDAGRRLTSEPFAIDPHVFEDEDGTRWLFYATDFLTHPHVGTGTVRDRMLDTFTLEGKPRPVTRARHAWQVYDPARREKGGVRWHTVEGPFVLKRRRLYYQMFSAGNWKNLTYGVSYATTRSLRAPGEWSQHADGERALPILRTEPGRVIGPGHNSVVLGPDGRQLYCVYHRWAMESGERVLCIDRLDWAGDRLLVLGPSDAPVPAPLPPTRVLHARPSDRVPLPAPVCLLRWTAPPPLALQLLAGAETVWRCEVTDQLRVQDAVLARNTENDCSLRVEVSVRRVAVELRGEGLRWSGEIECAPDTLVFLAGSGRAALTVGFEDLFDSPLPAVGWAPASGGWQAVEDGLACRGSGEILKKASMVPAEVVVSARALPGGGYGLTLGEDLWLRISEDGEGFRLDGTGGTGCPLPRGFAGREFQQLRLCLDALGTRVFWERAFLARLPPVSGPLALALQAQGRGAVFDAARVTARTEEDA